MGLFRHSRDRRRQFPFDKIATLRLAVLGILPAMMAAPPPAAAQQLQIVGFNEAQSRGAVFEIVANPGNCPTTFHPDTSGIGSVMVQVDCTSSSNRHNIVTVRLFSRILLNAPWIVGQAIAEGADVRVVQAPAFGGRDPTFVIEIGQGGGVSTLGTRVILKATAIVAEPICPNRSSVFVCSRNADCAAGFTCAAPCGACLASTFTTPAIPRTIRIDQMRDLGYGVEPRTGNENATFRVIWEASSRWNPGKRCPVSFDNGRTPAESVVAVLNCTARGSGARATFDMFNRITLNPPWTVETARVTPFQLGSGATVSNSTVPASGANSIFTRIQLDTPRGREARAAVSIRIKAALPDPLPNCIRIGPPGPPVCSTNADCPQNPRGSGGGPLGGFVARSSKCAVECGNRCVNR